MMGTKYLDSYLNFPEWNYIPMMMGDNMYQVNLVAEDFGNGSTYPKQLCFLHGFSKLYIAGSG